MAQTKAQKAAAAKKLASNQAKAVANITKVVGARKPRAASTTTPRKDYLTRNVGFEATGKIKTPAQIAEDLKALNKKPDVVEPVVPKVVPEVVSEFPKAGKILRYIPGSKPGYRIPVFADGKGGEIEGEEMVNPVMPGPGGFSEGGEPVTLAIDTFRNTLALMVGELEASQPWVTELHQRVQKFINTGSTVEEAQNLALMESEADKTSPFVKRFDAIFKLRDRLRKGEAIEVPTIAEYVKSEQALGETFRSVGLGDLANQKDIGRILGEAGRSVSDAATLVSEVFGAIDNAPKELKEDLQKYFPGVDRTSIARAILTGSEGVQALTKKVKSIEVLSAAESQGINIDLATGAELSALGATYGTAMGDFATVKQLERGGTLAAFGGGTFTQQEAIDLTFKKKQSTAEKARLLTEQEQARFSARPGMAASALRGQSAASIL